MLSRSHPRSCLYDENKSGKIVSRITSDTQELNQIILISLILLADWRILHPICGAVHREWRLTLLLMGIAACFRHHGTARHFARIATRQGSRAMAAVSDNIQRVSWIGVARISSGSDDHDEFSAINSNSPISSICGVGRVGDDFSGAQCAGGICTHYYRYVGAQFVFAGTITASAWYLFPEY
jgi:hypothetical protein